MAASSTTSPSSTILTSALPTQATTSLLTRYTPPVDCTPTFWALPNYSLGVNPNAMITAAALQNKPSCHLPTLVRGGAHGVDMVVFSPGVFISGYYPAPTITIGFQYATTSLCCPEGLTLLPSGPRKNECGKLVSSRGITIVEGMNGTKTVTTVVDSFLWVDTPYTVAWASSELDLFTPASLPLKITRQAKSDHSTQPSSKPSATESSNPASGLSNGAQAGIGVGATVVGIALGAVLMWFLFRKRSRRHKEFNVEDQDAKDANPSEVSYTHPDIPELSAEDGIVEIPTNEKAVEAYADVGAEFPEDWAAHEADDDMRHELDANYRGEELDEVATPIDGTPPKGIK